MLAANNPSNMEQNPAIRRVGSQVYYDANLFGEHWQQGKLPAGAQLDKAVLATIFKKYRIGWHCLSARKTSEIAEGESKIT